MEKTLLAVVGAAAFLLGVCFDILWNDTMPPLDFCANSVVIMPGHGGGKE